MGDLPTNPVVTGMQVVQALYQITAPVLLIAALIAFFVRSVSEQAAARRIEKLGDNLTQKIDALKDTLASINTTLRLGEERHTNLEQRVERLERAHPQGFQLFENTGGLRGS